MWRSLASAPALGAGGPRFESLYSDQVYYKGNSMTCRGYDSKAVKVSKTVKRMASTIRDNHVRGAYLRSFVAIAETNARGSKRDSK